MLAAGLPRRGALALALVSACATRPSVVTRVADGVVHEGRFILPEAYSAYALGAQLEARGDRRGALTAFELALAADPDAPEILTRIGRLECHRARAPSHPSAKRAAKAFQTALRIDPNHSMALAEMARCRARLGDPQNALRAALAAARVDPDSLETQLLVADLAETAGEVDLARRWLDALVTRSPDSRAAWLGLAAFADRHADRGREIRAVRALGGLGAPSSPAARQQALEDALAAGDLARARRAAVLLRVPAGELAARAALVGAWKIAREQAELMLAADPTDTDAWIALLAVEDMSRNARAWAKTLAAAPDDPATVPSPAARQLQGELLERHVGPEARRAWDAALGAPAQEKSSR